MSTCADGDPCEFYKTRNIKARKQHQCDACKASIPAGAYYNQTAAKFDGELESFKRCGRCELIYRHLEERMKREGDYDEVPAWLLDCGHDYQERWEQDPPDDIAALAFMTDEEAGMLLQKEPRP